MLIEFCSPVCPSPKTTCNEERLRVILIQEAHFYYAIQERYNLKLEQQEEVQYKVHQISLLLQ